MNNTSMCKQSLTEINLKTFKEAIFIAYKGGITSVAPLGFSGDTIVLYEQRNEAISGRHSQVSIRNYCGDAELLITDLKGNFLFYGRYNINFGVNFVAKQYHSIFKKCLLQIDEIMPNVSEFSNVQIPLNCPKTWGFDMLRAYQDSNYCKIKGD